MAGDLDDLLSDFDLQDSLNSNFLKSLPDYNPQDYLPSGTCPVPEEKRFAVTPIYDFTSFRFYPVTKRNSIIIGVIKSWQQISGDRKFDTPAACFSAAKRYQGEVKKANLSRFNAFPVIALFCHDKDERVPEIYQGNLDIITTFEPPVTHERYDEYYLVRNQSENFKHGMIREGNIFITSHSDINIVSITSEHIDPETPGLIENFRINSYEIQLWTNPEIAIENLSKCVTESALLDICYDVTTISGTHPEVHGVGQMVAHFATITVPGLHLGYQLLIMGYQAPKCSYSKLLMEIEELKAEITQLRAVPPQDEISTTTNIPDLSTPSEDSESDGDNSLLQVRALEPDPDIIEDQVQEPVSQQDQETVPVVVQETVPVVVQEPVSEQDQETVRVVVQELTSETTRETVAITQSDDENEDQIPKPKSPPKAKKAPSPSSPKKPTKPILKSRSRVSFNIPTKRTR